MLSNNPFNMHRANDEVLNESKFLIPEEIPANERTAFHGAAAGAAKDGKTSFSFAGKKYPVTMKKDTARAIADQKESVGKTAGDHGYYHLQKAKELAKKDGHDYDKLPQYDRTHDKHKDHYDSRAKKESVKKEATHTTDYFTGHKHAARAGMGVKVHSKGADGDNVTISHSDPKKLQKYVDNHLGGGKIKEAAGIPHKYTVDLYHKDHGSHDSFIKKAKSAGIKGAYSGVNKDGKVKVSLNHHDNSDGGTIHKFLKKHYDKDMTHGNMQTMKTGSSSQKESTMTFREKLMSVLEGDKASHYKGATKPEPMPKDDEHGAKKMKAGHPIKKDDHEETSTAAEKSTKPSKMRGNDNKQGDKNIIPSATKDTPANKTVKEKFNSLLKAYSVVEDYTHEFDVDSNHLKKVMSAAKKNGIKAKVHTMKGPGGGNPVVHLGHKDTDTMHKFVKKHYDPDYKKSDLNMHKL